ncbi:Hypothetical predicted protein, partial [Mytilus galloprovincialis]
MHIHPVKIPDKPNRKSILKRQDPDVYYPVLAELYEIPTVATPVPDALTDKPKDYHWLCWPEPKPKDEPPLRPHTSLGIHRALTTYGGVPGDDIEDRPSSTIPGYAFGDSE